MRCPKCSAGVGSKDKECRNCGASLEGVEPVHRRRHTPLGAHELWSEKAKREELETARYEAQHWHLDAQRPDEGDAVFVDRVKREATPLVLQFNQDVAEGRRDLNGRILRPREPGEEG